MLFVLFKKPQAPLRNRHYKYMTIYLMNGWAIRSFEKFKKTTS